MTMLSSSERLIRHSSSAWLLLRGCVALHKPKGLTQGDVKKHMQQRLAEELNEMDAAEKEQAIRDKWGE